MAYNCNHCGYRTNEVKASGAISAKGKRIELRVTKPEDLNRSFLKVYRYCVLKSNHSSLKLLFSHFLNA